MIEEWKPIPLDDPNTGVYEVSSEGRIRRGGKILSLDTNTDRYPSFTICINNIRRTELVHIIVAKVFIGERPPGLVVNHKDLDKKNNRVCNLEYITVAENNRVKTACRAKGKRICKLCGCWFEFRSAKMVLCSKKCRDRYCGRQSLRNAENEKKAKASTVLYKHYRRHRNEALVAP